MRIRQLKGLRAGAAVVLLAFIACSKGGGTKPSGFGAITGSVLTPYSAAASGTPVAGARVHITGGDFDSTTQTDNTGKYFMSQVPERTVTVSASLTACLSGTRSGIQIVRDDTVSADVTLESRAEVDTVPLPYSGARRMEIIPGMNRAVLLYDLPASLLVSVDLANGTSRTINFPDLFQTYDIKLINNNLAVFNYSSAAGFGLRFVDLTTMAVSGKDVVYDSSEGGFTGGGHIALDNTAEHIFVAHAVQGRPYFIGRVYAVSVADRRLVDADNNPDDGDAAFDTLLIRRSVGWAYSMAYDNATNEILVGNWDAGIVTAIAWNKWGTFDRSAHLTAPTPGVRIVSVNTQLPLFQPWFLGFAGGTGIAAWPYNNGAVHFGSGATSADLAYTDSSVTYASDAHHLVIVPPRGSWFTLFQDVKEPDEAKRQIAVEERSSTTLRRIYRFESRQFTLPDRGSPRAFAVDADNKKLYVAYNNRPILEVFCLP